MLGISTHGLKLGTMYHSSKALVHCTKDIFPAEDTYPVKKILCYVVVLDWSDLNTNLNISQTN